MDKWYHNLQEKEIANFREQKEDIAFGKFMNKVINPRNPPHTVEDDGLQEE